MVRDERATERARIQNEREAERSAALHSRERAKRLKIEEKESQLREWQLEVEEYVAKDNASLRVANEGPEVEDRNALFAELQQLRRYEAPDFVPPSLAPNVTSEVRQRHQEEAYWQSAGFHHPLSTLNAVQFVFAGVGALGGAATMLPQAPTLVGYAGALGIAVWAVMERSRHTRWSFARAQFLDQVEAEAQKKIAAELATKHAEAVEEARVAHAVACAREAAGHDKEQSRRLSHVQALLRGDEVKIQEELAEIFPLELEPELETSTELQSPRALRLMLQAKLATAL